MFFLRIKLGILRKGLDDQVGDDEDNKQRLSALLSRIKYHSPNQGFELQTVNETGRVPGSYYKVWDCGTETYYEHSKITTTYDSAIEEWFPDKKKKVEKSRAMVDDVNGDEEGPPKKQRKISSRKIRRARLNGQANWQVNREANGQANGQTNGQTAQQGAGEKAKQLNCPPEKELGLPSWVARITAAPFDIFPHPGMDMVKMGRKNADPLVGVPQDGHRNYNAGQTKRLDLKHLKFRRRPRCGHYSLYVRGFWLDTVESVAQVSQGGAIPGEWLDMAGWPEARRSQRPGEVLKDPPPEFWRTLVADREMNDRNPPYYYARACKETIVNGGLQSGAVNTTALMHNERNSIVAEFCRRVQAVIWNRALIKTKNGSLGLASSQVKKGDMVCIIYGCTVPLILRKGEYKKNEEVKLEKFEDGVESMKRLVRKCEKNRARRADWERKKDEAEEDDGKEKLKTIEEATREYNNKIERKNLELGKARFSDWKACTDRRKKWRNKKLQALGDEDKEKEIRNIQEQTRNLNKKPQEIDEMEHTENESEDETDDETTAKMEGRKRFKQKKADKRDTHRHYEFLGESYIHGMMDGEAVVQNFYTLKPDHSFEIR